ncbi:MAG TPA: hypothetical protein ENJ53_05370 [Phaeodactylibacter sp.]|nr:hypothetical protein [Phaeodactylibacter sp.]
MVYVFEKIKFLKKKKIQKQTEKSLRQWHWVAAQCFLWMFVHGLNPFMPSLMIGVSAIKKGMNGF